MICVMLPDDDARVVSGARRLVDVEPDMYMVTDVAKAEEPCG